MHTLPNAVSVDELSYCVDSCTIFGRIRELPGTAFFDSAAPYSTGGRFDIMTACPLDLEVPQLCTGADLTQSRAFFDALSAFNREYFGGIQPVSQDIPFCGGILGYLDYDAGSGLNKLSPHRQARSVEVTSSHLKAYEWAIVQDHLLGKAVLVCLPGVAKNVRRNLLSRLRGHHKVKCGAFNLLEDFRSNLNRDEYQAAFNTILAYIHAGDCYQVNLAQRFSSRYEGDPWSAYKALRAVAAAPFSAYIATAQDNAIMCLSPERFVSVRGKHVEASPIKGTRPRYDDPEADQRAAAQLCSSSKDRAENLMIVDLLRNDLGRSCVAGSIHVDRLFELQSFQTVHHLVSTISGELMPERDAWALLRDSFPGGSITGAPKRRAMEIIAELEPHPRQAYCGSMLYVSADGRMDSNIAIRTLLCQNNNIHCWGGGGIVADSVCEQEYQETFDKVGKFLQLLQDGV